MNENKDLEKHGIVHKKSQGLIDYAYRFAEKAHRGQLRKYTLDPYIIHPIAVAKMVSEVTEDCEAIAAALLHDVVEDTDTTIEEIEAAFGFRPRIFVEGLTEFSLKSDGSRTVRKNLDLRYLKRQQPLVKTIKLADLIHNSESIIKYSPAFALTYMAEMESLLTHALKEGDATLLSRAWKVIDAYHKTDPLYRRLIRGDNAAIKI